MLIDAKSNLARLMATENILIEQKNVPTAYFDLETRTLTIPTLDGKLSSELLDLLLGHEVGHALETPIEGWHNSIIDLKINRSILNVCEDIRIEKKIKRKFPGIRSSFIKGYNELLERDFFGVKGKNLNELNFIDRLNLYTKGGVSLGIEFLKEELSLLDEAQNTETFDDVVSIAQKIEKYMEEYAEEETSKTVFLLDNDFDGENDDVDYEENGDDFSFEKTDVSPTGKEKYVDSYTDSVFREREKNLISKEAKQIKYVNIPDLNLNEIIIPYSEIADIFDSYGYTEYDKQLFATKYNSFKNESNKVVSYLVKEFELRKNASQMARAKVSKSGEINLKKIHEYRYNEDIFSRITKVPNGKSHGLVLFLDWSGSMDTHLESTVKQLLNIVFFCRKLNIPFEVYAFTSRVRGVQVEEYSSWYNKIQQDDLMVAKFSLLNFLSSNMTSAQFNKQCQYLLGISSMYDRPLILQLSGTPLNECILASFNIIPKFKKEKKLEIVNTIFLTDGDGHDLPFTFDDRNRPVRINRYGGRVIYRDTVTKTMCEENTNKSSSFATTECLLNLLRQRAGGNLIGFYLANQRDLRNAIQENVRDDVIVTAHLIQLRKNKYTFVQNVGYNEYYFLNTGRLDTDDGTDFEVKGNTTRALVSAFSKYTTNRIQNRIILNRFISLIS
jgi:hypothetical protein